MLHSCNVVMFFPLLCSLPTSWLVTSLGVPVPSFHMSVSGTLGCFPGVDNSKGFFLEPVSVAPSLRVFSLKSYDLHASVRALAEIASGGFETDSNGTFLLSRCDMCGLTRFGSRPSRGLTWRGSCPCFQFIFVFVMFAALLLHRALFRLFRFGSCSSCGFTWLGSCPYCQFFFAFAYSLGLLVRSMMLQFLSMSLVSVSWMLDAHEASSLVGQFKVKRQSSGKPTCLKLSVQFSPQVIGRMAAAFIVAFHRFYVKIVAVASAAATSGAFHGYFAFVGMFLSLVVHFATVLPLSLEFAWTILQATEEVRQQAAAAFASDYLRFWLSTTHSPRKGPREAFQAKATPRVDVAEVPGVPSSQQVLCVKSCFDQFPGLFGDCTPGSQVSPLPGLSFLLVTLSSKTLTMNEDPGLLVSELLDKISVLSALPSSAFYLTSGHKRLKDSDTLKSAGLERDALLRMRGRLLGGTSRGPRNPQVPGSWHCSVCNLGGCWPGRDHCFLLDSSICQCKETPSGITLSRAPYPSWYFSWAHDACTSSATCA